MEEFHQKIIKIDPNHLSSIAPSACEPSLITSLPLFGCFQYLFACFEQGVLSQEGLVCVWNSAHPAEPQK